MRRISLRKLSGKVLVATVAAGMAFATMVASPVQAQAADQGYPTGDEGCVAAQSWTAPDPATFADNQNKSGYPGKLRWDKGKRVAFYWPDSVDSVVKSSKVDDAKLQVAADHLERLIDLYTNHDGLDFPGPSCMLSAKYKVIIVLNNNGGYYGGTVRYKNSWDKKKMYPSFQMPAQAMTDYWGMAHELMHSFQMGPNAYGAYDYDGTNTTWLWESHANWMAFQANGKNNLHCTELGINNPSKLYGSGRDRYCNWTFMEYLAETQPQGVKLMTDMWTKATRFPEYSAMERPENPLQILRLSMGKTQAEFNDLFGEWAMHNVTWDYPGKTTAGTQTVGDVMRKTYGGVENANVAGGRYVRTNRLTYLDPVAGKANRYKVLPSQAPAQGGYNTIKLLPKTGATSITVDFHGIEQATSAAASWPSGSAYPDRPKESPNAYKPNSGWRWGVVAVDANGNPRYSEIQSSTDGRLTVPVKAGDKGVYLVVVGAPTVMHRALWDQRDYSIYRYPYFVDLKDATAMDMAATVAGKSGWTRHTNPDGSKGGWVKNGAKVAATAYIAPGARVFAGTISGNARIEDHATILNGTVTDNAVVKGISVMINANSKIYGNAVIDTTFQAIDYFRAVTIGGTAQVHGVTEYNTGKDVTAGVYSGGVWDGQTTGYLSKLTSYDEVTRTPTRADYLADRPVTSVSDGWIERDAIKTSVGGAASWSPEGGKLNDGVLVDSTWPTGDGGNVNAKVWGTYGVAAAKTYAQYDWAGAHTVDSSRVQFWSDHAKEAASGLEKPKSWKIQYLDADGKTWKDVTPVAGGAYTTVRNSGASRATDAAKGWSTVTFAPVRTKSLRLVATPAADANVGIAVAEWGVHEAKPAATLDSIAVTTKPTKTTYTVGDKLDAAGMVVTGTYSDGSTRVLAPSEYDVTFDSAKFGTVKVTVTAKATAGGAARSASFDVTVRPAAHAAEDGWIERTASKTTVSAEAGWSKAGGKLNDGIIVDGSWPTADDANVNDYTWGTWGQAKDGMYAQYDFAGTVRVDRSRVQFWANFAKADDARGGLETPRDWKIQYLDADGKTWKDVTPTASGAYTTVRNNPSARATDAAKGWSTVTFAPVGTKSLRLVMDPHAGAGTFGVAVAEWGVHEAARSSDPVTGVTVAGLSGPLAFGASAKLTATVTPANTTGDRTVTWSSSDASVASVAADGTVTGLKAGKATITATSRSAAAVKGSLEVTVAADAGNVAPSATVSASYTNKWLTKEPLKKINDGTVAYANTPDATWNNYGDTTGAEPWLQLAWTRPQSLTGAKVFLWTDNGGVPKLTADKAWRLQAQAGDGTWKDVALRSGSSYGVDYAAGNAVEFASPVRASALRVVFPKGAVTGVSEVEAFGAADPDTVRPVIKGAADVSLDYGAAFDAKAGVTASDDRDGDLTSGIVVSGDAVDTRKAGVYTLTYSVADKAGNTASVTRRVTVRPQSVAPDLRPGAGNVAPDATVSASYTNKTLSNGGADAPKRINDGVARFGTDVNVAWNSWRDDAAADETWVQLAWPQRMDLTKAGLYFWTDNGGVPLPGSWRLQYADASGAWRDVALAAGSAYGAKAGVANEVSFDKVSTDRLRVVFPRVEKNFGVGVTEFAAYGAKSAEKPVGTKASSVTVLGRRSLKVGDSVKLAARVAPAGVDDPSVSWSSSDTSVATVDAAGRVRALRAGTVRIVATARDGSGVSGALSVTVAAADAAGPVVSGAADAVVSLGSPFDALDGVAARDDRDGDLTSHVLVSGSVDTDKAGSYTLTYTVADRAGNKATVTRTITVR